MAGLTTIDRYLGIGIGNMITPRNPDRVVIGGGIGVAGDLLPDTAREEVLRRTRMTSLAEVEIVSAELATLAGAIGAAVHGAERAALAVTAGGATA